MGGERLDLPRKARMTSMRTGGVAEPSPAAALAAKMVAHLPPICTVAEVAKTMRCSPRNVRRWISMGALHSFRVVQAQQARVLIPRASVEALVASSLR
jgi:hypothetical protein